VDFKDFRFEVNEGSFSRSRKVDAFNPACKYVFNKAAFLSMPHLPWMRQQAAARDNKTVEEVIEAENMWLEAINGQEVLPIKSDMGIAIVDGMPFPISPSWCVEMG
jgi:hypothetical protein